MMFTPPVNTAGRNRPIACFVLLMILLSIVQIGGTAQAVTPSLAADYFPGKATMPVVDVLPPDPASWSTRIRRTPRAGSPYASRTRW
jgi:hypothetical protein